MIFDSKIVIFSNILYRWMIILNKNFYSILNKAIFLNKAFRSIPKNNSSLPILNDLILSKNDLIIINE